FPEEATQPQIGDTFALHSLAAPQSRSHLLRSSAAHLLKVWESLSPTLPLPGLTPELSQALWGGEREAQEHWLDPTQRDERERQTAAAAHTFLDLVRQALPLLPPGPSLLHHALERWLSLLHKAITDEFVIQANDDARHATARHATGKERGSFVLGSSVDPEATFRKHGEQNDLGYNIHVSATRHFVREIFATTGAVPDGAGVARLIAHQREQGHPLPPKLIYDRAAGSPKLFHDVDQASQGQTQLVATLIDHSKRSSRFGPLDFTLNQDGSLTCPAGQTTTIVYRSNAADGWTYRFPAKQCQDCPLWEACRGPLPQQPPTPENAPATACQAEKPATKRKGPGPKSHRQVFISSYRSMQRTAILYTQTEAFLLDMKLRPLIEGTIACLVRYNGARHARGLGLVNADCQVRGAALAFNLKRWHTLTLAREKAQRIRTKGTATLDERPPEVPDG
ncbi:transposase, partial [Arthrospira platensis SPKY2]